MHHCDHHARMALQAKSKLLSAGVVISPPWQMAWPLSMSWRTTICSTARPGPIECTVIPSIQVAWSPADISSCTCSASA